MRYASVLSFAIENFEHYPVRVETDISKGIFSFSIVGLGDKAISESRDRIISAIKHSGFESPKTKGNKIVSSLSPAYFKKQGSRFDLAIAISYLLATQNISLNSKEFPINKCYFIGELALNGDILHVPDTIKSVVNIPEHSIIFISDKEKEMLYMLAGIVADKTIYTVKNLKEVAEIISGRSRREPFVKNGRYIAHDMSKDRERTKQAISMWDSIRDQERAKRALMVSVAGGHHLVIFGPPGLGKTMLADSASEILPILPTNKQAEILSMNGDDICIDDIRYGPFRKVGSTISSQALIGGGNSFRAGEITLAHNGVLFIDEFLEMKKETIEKLREPLENKSILQKKHLYRQKIPASFHLIATANLCPCGYIGSQRKKCTCRIGEIIKYQKKISGPVSDRIDMWVKVNDSATDNTTSHNTKDTQTRQEVRNLLGMCRDIQYSRQQKLNNELSANEIVLIISSLSKEASMLFKNTESLLSIRGRHKLIKVARTIADLDKSEAILTKHISEALTYRKENYIDTFQN